MVNTCIMLIITITYRRLSFLATIFEIGVSIQYHKIDAMLLVLTVVNISSWSQQLRCFAEEHVDERSGRPSRLLFPCLCPVVLCYFPAHQIFLILLSFVLPVFLLCVWEGVLPLHSPLCLPCPCPATFVTWVHPACRFACLCPLGVHIAHIGKTVSGDAVTLSVVSYTVLEYL